ncbi:MAG: DUF1045 domain-containing protein [Marivibrio sp.]|uniref:DUF1045 domain-containing protein n=1 Tax=Marivibrio sp. TaxID=2039719 RepID=UPI0032EE15BE
MEDFARYAVYYAPRAGSALADFGNAWLGRDPASGEPTARPAAPGLSADRIAEITEAPARYGFHGTLKAPFALAEGATRGDLETALAVLGARLAPPVAPGGLALTAIGPFLALTPQDGDGALSALAARVVEDLDSYRAPPGAAELARRRRGDLNAAQEALLQRWGYPYVMGEFRFHLTLTGPLDPAARAAVASALEPVVAPFGRTPFTLDALCLFGDPGGGAPFRLIRRVPLSG